ncbi:MAG: type II toxin-antitoxin system mRNA interferase toxin, RelE/StbE family [Sulfurovaceae bacterium]|nr:type II toxin-antitoxin system mRNA interferase toxin, RelE/StbE family [Sulfurovaceae bacterium]MDD5549535.1 type II toxin-antitoxin system mRNA interferase toxin, RelE/StbE family [Sulfurovaceae bacterium]
MNYKIVQTDAYRKKLVKFFKKHSDLLGQYAKTIKLLELDPFHPSLRLHKLQGKLGEYYSVSITMKYRVILEIIIKDKELMLLDIGSHDDVY